MTTSQVQIKIIQETQTSPSFNNSLNDYRSITDEDPNNQLTDYLLNIPSANFLEVPEVEQDGVVKNYEKKAGILALEKSRALTLNPKRSTALRSANTGSWWRKSKVVHRSMESESECGMTPTRKGSAKNIKWDQISVGARINSIPGLNEFGETPTLGGGWDDKMPEVLKEMTQNTDRISMVFEQEKASPYSPVHMGEAEELSGDQLAIKKALEILIKEDKTLEHIEQLRDYFMDNLADYMKRHLPQYQVEIPDGPLSNKRALELRFRNTNGGILSCWIRRKEKFMQAIPGESLFLMYFLNSSQSPSTRRSKYEDDLRNNIFSFSGQLDSNENTPPSYKSTSPVNVWNRNPKKNYSKIYPSDENNLAAFLVSDSDSHTSLATNDKSFADQINRHINNFVKKLPQDKDWTILKQILKLKFFEIETITPKKVRRYLRKLEKKVASIDEVVNGIMERKIDINFFEIPMGLTAKEIATSETAIINFIRDVAWAPLAYLEFDLFEDKSNSTLITQGATQMIICMFAMALAATIYHIVKRRVSPKDTIPNFGLIDFFTTLFIWAGAALAIPGWNALQDIGNNIGLAMNLNRHLAGYFSSLFPGLPEGPIQGVMSIISNHTLNKTWHKFTLRTFIKQMLIFATFGAVPGDMWQVAYQLISDSIEEYENWSTLACVLLLGLGLATTVYIGNVAFGTGYEREINKSHLIIEFEAIEESIDIKKSVVIDKSHANTVSYNGRPGAPKEDDIVLITHDNSQPDHQRRKYSSRH